MAEGFFNKVLVYIVFCLDMTSYYQLDAEFQALETAQAAPEKEEIDPAEWRLRTKAVSN